MKKEDKMDEKLWAVVALVILSILIGFSFGYTVAVLFECNPLQDAAVERGYAEWAVPTTGRGDTVFQWVE